MQIILAQWVMQLWMAQVTVSEQIAVSFIWLSNASVKRSMVKYTRFLERIELLAPPSEILIVYIKWINTHCSKHFTVKAFQNKAMNMPDFITGLVLFVINEIFHCSRVNTNRLSFYSQRNILSLKNLNFSKNFFSWWINIFFSLIQILYITSQEDIL